MKIIVYTSFDCLLRVDKKETILTKNENVELENTSSFFVYPTGKRKLIPFEVDINAESAFYRIVKKDGKILVFLLDGIFAENIEKYSFTFSGKSCNVEISTSKVSFSTKRKRKVLFIPSDAKNFECGNILHIVYVKFSVDDEECIILFNISSSMTKIFYGRSIKIEKDSLVIETNYSKQTFYIDKDGLKVRESKTLSSKAHPPQLLTFNFLQAIKDYDYSNAFSMLSPSLSSSQSEQSLKEFFGEISYIYPLDPYTIFTISNGNNKLFTFEIENGQIVDIQT